MQSIKEGREKSVQSWPWMQLLCPLWTVTFKTCLILLLWKNNLEVSHGQETILYSCTNNLNVWAQHSLSISLSPCFRTVQPLLIILQKSNGSLWRSKLQRWKQRGSQTHQVSRDSGGNQCIRAIHQGTTDKQHHCCKLDKKQKTWVARKTSL